MSLDEFGCGLDRGHSASELKALKCWVELEQALEAVVRDARSVELEMPQLWKPPQNLGNRVAEGKAVQVHRAQRWEAGKARDCLLGDIGIRQVQRFERHREML